MPTRDQYMQALRQADAAGNADEAQRIAAMMKADTQSQAPAAPAQKQDLSDPDNPNNPANGDFSAPLFGIEGMPTVTLPQGAGRVMAGAGRSVVNSSRSLKQMAAYLTGNKDWQNQLSQEEADARQTDAPLMATTGGKVGNLAGEVAQMALPAGELSKAAQLAKMGRMGTVGAGALAGAIQGSLQPTTGDESRALNIAGNAAVGGAIPAVPAALGGIKGMLLRSLADKGGSTFGRSLAGKAMGNAVADQTVDLNTPELRNILDEKGSVIPNKIKALMMRHIQNAEAGSPGASSPLFQGSRPMTGDASSSLYSDLTQTANVLKDTNPAGAAALNAAKRVVNDSQKDSLSAARYAALKRARAAYEVGTSPYGLLQISPYANPAAIQGLNNMLQRPPEDSDNAP